MKDTRRNFIKTTAAAGFSMLIPASARGQDTPQEPVFFRNVNAIDAVHGLRRDQTNGHYLNRAALDRILNGLEAGE